MKILLACSAGMSTSLLVNNMKKFADASDVIEARPVRTVPDILDDWDVLLLGPQVRHILRRVTKLVGDQAVVDVIDGPSYGRCDGAAVLKQAEDLYAGK